MCLAVPGKLIEVQVAATATERQGVVDFQGSRFPISLAFTPEAQVGDWVLVHAGFAINRLDEAEAREIWDLLRDGDAAGQQPLDEIFPPSLTGADPDCV